MSPPILVDRDRSILRISGRDPVRMIQGLATADIATVSADRGAYTAFLDAKGRMVADARVFRWPGARESGDLLLGVNPGAAAGLQAHIQRFVPPLFARQEDRSDEWRVLGVYGAGSGTAIAPLAAADVPADAPEEHVVPLVAGAGTGAFAARSAITGEEGWELYVAAESADAVRSELGEAGVEAAGAAEFERRRVAAGKPMWGAELTPDVIPLEAGLLERAISQTKGCYTGQEVIVRILHRGHVNRHLRRLEFAADPPKRGTELFEPGLEKPRGVVTSAVVGPGGPIGLGYVRREIEPPGELRVGATDGPVVRVMALD